MIVLTNFQHFAVEESHSSSSSGSWAKRKQLLVYTLLDLMHKKDLHFLVREVANICFFSVCSVEYKLRSQIYFYALTFQLIGVTAAVDLQLLLEKRVVRTVLRKTSESTNLSYFSCYRSQE